MDVNTPRLKAIVRGADTRCRHDGLALQIKQAVRLDVDKLENGEFVLCLNTKRTILTLYGPNRIIVQQKRSTPITSETALKNLPGIFLNTKKLDYNKALQKELYEEFPKWVPKKSKKK